MGSVRYGLPPLDVRAVRRRFPPALGVTLRGGGGEAPAGAKGSQIFKFIKFYCNFIIFENIFAIDDKIYWKSWGKNKQYSKFPANVVLALSEQDEEYQISFKELKSSFKDLKCMKHKEVIRKEGSANENSHTASERDGSIEASSTHQD